MSGVGEGRWLKVYIQKPETVSLSRKSLIKVQEEVRESVCEVVI